MVFYSCEKCGKQFNQKGHYNKHINKKLPCINETKLKEIISVVVNEKLNEINNKKEKIDLFISKDIKETINIEIPTMTKSNIFQPFLKKLVRSLINFTKISIVKIESTS